MMRSLECDGDEDVYRSIIFSLSENNARDAILRLERDSLLEIIEWFGIDKGQGVITKDYRDLKKMGILKEYYGTCPKDIYDKVYLNLYKFLDVVYRNGEAPLYEYVNTFNLWVNYYYNLFQSKKINVVFFGDVPHFGVDSIAKDVAEAMGISIVMFLQMNEANKFFAISHVDDIGCFDSLPNRANEHLMVEEKFEKKLFYMEESYQKKVNTPVCNTFEKFEKIFSNLKKSDFKFWLCERLYDTLLKKINKSYKKYCYRRDMKRILSQSSLDLGKKYVYFPLHYQPEMTTSVFGNEYCDQLLAIERLADFIPADWIIYVKENPIQTYYMRDHLFFDRLSLISKVQFVEKKVNTYDLIRHSQFVSTITGTAGWEAISGGKPALVFGLAWYRKLPGVFEFKANPSLRSILNCEIDHIELVEKYNCLFNKAYTGIVECGFEIDVEEYSDSKNNEYLFNAFNRILSLLHL